MKKIFLDELPHGGKGISKKRVNWKKSIGHEVNFIFNNIKGKLKIIDYYKMNNNDFLKIRYNKEEYEIRRNDFSKYKIATILGIYNYDYKYKIGDIITDVKKNRQKSSKSLA